MARFFASRIWFGSKRYQTPEGRPVRAGKEYLLTNSQGKWQVVAEPLGANPQLKPTLLKGKARERKTGEEADKSKDNVGGIVVYVALGSRREEVARVGFIRKNTENPKTAFSTKLKEIMALAHQTCDTLNGLTPDGELQ